MDKNLPSNVRMDQSRIFVPRNTSSRQRPLSRDHSLSWSIDRRDRTRYLAAVDVLDGRLAKQKVHVILRLEAADELWIVQPSESVRWRRFWLWLEPRFCENSSHLESYWWVRRFGEASVLHMAGSAPEKSVGAPVNRPPVGPLANNAVTFACGE